MKHLWILFCVLAPFCSVTASEGGNANARLHEMAADQHHFMLQGELSLAALVAQGVVCDRNMILLRKNMDEAERELVKATTSNSPELRQLAKALEENDTLIRQLYQKLKDSPTCNREQ